MKIQTVDYIDATIESLFKTRNDKQLLRAFIYRRVMDYTPKEVGKVLRLSQPQINVLIQTIPHKCLADVFFHYNYLAAVDACQKFVIKKKTQSHLAHLKDVRNRLANHYATI